MTPATIEVIGAMLFGIALIHTFSTQWFERLAHTHPAHAGIWHFLGEVEVVFGFWAMVLVVAMLITDGKEAATAYIDGQSFTEPMFVFAIMVISGSRPILQFAMTLRQDACPADSLAGRKGVLLRNIVFCSSAWVFYHRTRSYDSRLPDPARALLFQEFRRASNMSLSAYFS